jgi:hypothetical protein
MEKFEISDYDLNNEFYRGRKKLTKHQQIYGNNFIQNLLSTRLVGAIAF